MSKKQKNINKKSPVKIIFNNIHKNTEGSTLPSVINQKILNLALGKRGV